MSHILRVNTNLPAGTSAQMKAARHGGIQSIRELLNCGAGLDIADRKGDTALRLAGYAGQETIKVLKDAGATR